MKAGAKAVTRTRLLDALASAEAHVFRQQGHGKHPQDRTDAEEWWARFADVRETIQAHRETRAQ